MAKKRGMKRGWDFGRNVKNIGEGDVCTAGVEGIFHAYGREGALLPEAGKSKEVDYGEKGQS